MPSEFELIARYFVQRNEGEPAGIALGAGDDCALLVPSPGQRLAVSVDTSVVDVHFPAQAPAWAVGYRALAVSLSDLAAMGARARWCTMAVTLPEADETWLEAFSQGFHTLCRECGVALVGGDVTRGNLSISVTVHGEVPAGAALYRSGGKADDIVAVTGPLGGGHGGLRAWQRGVRDLADPLLSRYLLPKPRLAAGLALRGLANCAIDISDGLLADLDHLCAASHLGAELDMAQLPLAVGLEDMLGVEGARHAALCGGDDYELLFSLPEASLAEAQRRLHECGLGLWPIGRLHEGAGIAGVDAVAVNGWQHFPGGAE
ncbi:thiamine-phosphate kinase [Halomonas sp. McH1-25]|uniref:thiamine-phosphate kinase n=1 Tax=unclassified Halomonas TaxID=2609666 RepID=UPI001EF71EDB|nr:MULTISPECIES: thiamine-phosphate kinase [unclassified Halomonas]MCG7600423.1 thiamine-phosphate kinase [Halomonas sp. McH1-25]MCP1343189.1 thiamine-phosphate kinase [Halomonas sp. FL8]MCP1361562.1 thiamine-phosphate kinase [Halomonas sp. BBD45]